MRRYAILFMIVFTVGCDASVAEPELDIVGILTVQSELAGVNAPATGKVGSPLVIEVNTWAANYGQGCIERGTTEVEHKSTLLRITPVDRLGAPTCFDAWVRLRHEVTIIPTAAGTLNLEVVGRAYPSLEQVTVAKHITISP